MKPLRILTYWLFLLSLPLFALAERPPDIVVILADDLGYADLSAYGSEIPTPNIDSIGEDGLRFTQFYTNSVCVPTRAALLTGLYPQQVGRGLAAQPGWPRAGSPVDDGLPPAEGHYNPASYGESIPGLPGGLSENCLTLAEALREGGYVTLMSGKWHCGEDVGSRPLDRGFDRFFGILGGAANYFNPDKDYIRAREVMLDDSVFSVPDNGFYMTDAITDQALRFLEESVLEDRPVFLYLAFTAPHAPLQAPESLLAEFRGKYSEGWDVLRHRRFTHMSAMGIMENGDSLPGRSPLIYDWKVEKLLGRNVVYERRMETYAAMISRMDAGVGRVLRWLDKNGRAANTLLIFCSDNGADGGDFDSDKGELDARLLAGSENSYETNGPGWASASNVPFRGYKGQTLEGGLASPMLVRWPKQIGVSGAIVDEVAHVMDFMPTFLEVAGLKYPSKRNGFRLPPLEGRSLMPVFRGEELEPRPPLYFECFGNRAMRDGDWKLVSQNRVWSLYNLKTDRAERFDLRGAKPERVREMAERYDAWSRRVGAGVPPAVPIIAP